MNFQLGDRVVCVVPYRNVSIGETGTLVDFEDFAPEYGVRWDDAHVDRHNCQGHCESKHGWYVNRRNIEIEAPMDLGEFSLDLAPGLMAELLGG